MSSGPVPATPGGRPAHLDTRERKRLGAFYTPGPVARRIVAEALALFGERLPTSVLDPAVGSGAFLLAFAELARARVGTDEPGLSRSLHGLDLDREALGLCAAALADRGFVPSPGHLHRADALAEAWPRSRFELIVGNPPFRNIVRLPAAERAALKARFSTFHNKCDLYGLFLERSLAHLAPGGVLAMILADSFLGTSSFGPLRELVFASPQLTPRAMWTLDRATFDAAVGCRVLFLQARAAGDSDLFQVAHLFADGTLEDQGSLPLAPLRARAHRSAALPTDLRALTRAEAMAEAGVPLGSLASFTLGVKTGDDARFLAPRASGFPEEDTEVRRLMPALRGRDVQRFRITGERVLDYRPEILRTVHGARPRRPEAFARPEKVLLRETSGRSLIAALDTRGRIPLDTLHALWPTDPARCSHHYLLGVLSARPVEWWYGQHHPGSHVKLGELRELPVPAPEGPWAEAIETLARELGGPLAEVARARAQRQLDDRVAEGFGFTGGWRE